MSTETAEAPSVNGHTKKDDVTKTSKSKKSDGTIEIPEFDIRRVSFKIKSETPLIVNRFPEKAKQMMLDKQMKKGTKGREAKNPQEQYEQSLYMFKDGKRTGFPAVGFKAAMVRAGQQLNIPMTQGRGRFHVLAEEGDLVEIHGEHEIRDDMVRLATGVADVRFRGFYKEWWANITITYNAGTMSEELLASILNMAGFACGIGEWRPEKSNSGMYGLFKIDSGK